MSAEAKDTAGIGFVGMLTIAFIVLKLCGKIAWSWVWVIAPIWIPLALLALIFTVAVLVAAISSRETTDRDEPTRFKNRH